MDSLQFGAEVCEIQEDLVRLNLKILSMIDSFTKVESYEEMEKLNGDIRGKFDLMRKEIQSLRELAKKQVNPQSSVMLKTDANNHEDQMTGSLLAFKKANIACISVLNSKGRESLLGRKSKRSDLDSKQKDKEEMVSENSKATEQLRSISRNLAQTVQNSSRTMEELVVQSKTISEANDEFKSMGSVISQSRKLITKYGRRIMTDRVLIFWRQRFSLPLFFIS